MTYAALLTHLLLREDLSAAQMDFAMRGILSGEWTPAQTAGFLVALKTKGETTDELAAAVQYMRKMAIAVPLQDDSAVDTCGTGGDGAGLFNISTATAFVAAAAGARIAKHGNRALSGTSGSSDVLAELHIPPIKSPQQIAAMINDIGIGFMFAPNHHPAMRHAAPVRKELGIRTMFNLLGPMTNPAGVRRQVTGVFDVQLLTPYLETLAAAGAVRAMTVHGGGLDEISISGETDIAELKNGTILRRTISPTDVGLSIAAVDSLRVSSVGESAAMIRQVLSGQKGAARDIVLLNAAAVLIVAELADDFADGVVRAAAAIDSGAAQNKLQQLVAAAANAAE